MIIVGVIAEVDDVMEELCWGCGGISNEEDKYVGCECCHKRCGDILENDIVNWSDVPHGNPQVLLCVPHGECCMPLLN